MSVTFIQSALGEVRKHKPLIVNITNYVAMNTSANALLAIGASPIMAHSQDEMSEMMRFAGALVINIGTLDSLWIPRMRYAIEQANQQQKPVVLDPVGCGATKLRTRIAREFSDLANNVIIRANASEIIALSGQPSRGKGVDAEDASHSAINAAKQLANDFSANVVISGAVDHVISRTSHIALSNGSSMMPFVTGTGCSLSALTGAFAAIGESSGLAATAIMGIAGQLATEISSGPGSLQVNLIDALYNMNSDTIEQYLKMQAIEVIS